MVTRRRLLLVSPMGCVLWSPLQAQPRPKLIGVLVPGPSADLAPAKDEFIRAMRNLGYIEGTHFVIVIRAAEGEDERLPALAEELVKLNVSLILADTSTAVKAAQRATANIPIVFGNVGNPVAAGFAESLSRPGRNMTGLSNIASLAGQLVFKQLELLKQMVPVLARVALLLNPASPYYSKSDKDIKVREGLGLSTYPVTASTVEELEPAFKSMSAFRAEAVLVTSDPYFGVRRQQIAALALRSRLPSMFGFSSGVLAGGLMSYSADSIDGILQVATYVDKIFKGAKPGDLPIQQPTKFELFINRRTADALQLKIPQTLLLQAAKVID